MAGLDSGKMTTTMRVENVRMEQTDLIELIKEKLIENWMLPDSDAEKYAREQARWLVHVGASFPLGAVVEKRGNAFSMRKINNESKSQRPHGRMKDERNG